MYFGRAPSECLLEVFQFVNWWQAEHQWSLLLHCSTPAQSPTLIVVSNWYLDPMVEKSDLATLRYIPGKSIHFVEFDFPGNSVLPCFGCSELGIVSSSKTDPRSY